MTRFNQLFFVIISTYILAVAVALVMHVFGVDFLSTLAMIMPFCLILGVLTCIGLSHFDSSWKELVEAICNNLSEEKPKHIPSVSSIMHCLPMKDRLVFIKTFISFLTRRISWSEKDVNIMLLAKLYVKSSERRLIENDMIERKRYLKQ